MSENTLRTLNFTKIGLINNSFSTMIDTNNKNFTLPQRWSDIVPITWSTESKKNTIIIFKGSSEQNETIIYELKGYVIWPIINPTEIKKYLGKLHMAPVYSNTNAGLTTNIIFSPKDNQVNMIQYGKNKIISWLLGTSSELPLRGE